MNTGKLVIGVMPLGYEEITSEMKRAIEEADYIYCERVDPFLYAIYVARNPAIKTKAKIIKMPDSKSGKKIEESIMSYQVSNVLDIIKSGKSILIVTESGYPSIEDPGWEYIYSCHKNNLQVEIIPGASISTVAFVMSGFKPDAHGFITQAFFNVDKIKKRDILKDLFSLNYPVVIIEENMFYKDTLLEIKNIFKEENFEVFVGVELLKINYRTHLIDIDEAIDYFSKKIIGLHCIVVRKKN